MSFFKKSKPRTTTNNTNEGNDGSGFLHPESSLSSNREDHHLSEQQHTEWSKERTSQQLELEDVHNNNHAQPGCCGKLIELLIKSLFIIDIAIGITLIVYGSLLLTQFTDPAMAAVIFCLMMGSIHVLTSSLGIISLCKNGCQRFGLVIAAYIGPYIALVYFTIVIGLMTDSSGFLQYLEDNHEVMYLGPNVAENCKKLLPLFYVILIVLGILEASRFCVLIKIQERLVQHDVNETLIPRSSRTNNNTEGNSALTEALLGDNETASVATGGGGDGGSTTVERDTTGTPNWWEKSSEVA